MEPLVKRLMVKYLGEMEEDDLILFVLEHLKDHKGPQKLVEGLEPVSIS
jgi:RNA-binding protein 25